MAENYQNDQNMVLDWNDTIESDGQEFITLEEGDYVFEVTGFERGRFPGGQKIPACNKAALTLQVKTDAGTAVIRTDLLLYKTMEWKLSSFFRCIGQKKHGERLTMDWSKVIGSRGRAHFKPRTYTDRDGKGGSGMRFPSRETVERVRRDYPVGTRVELIQMEDVQAPPVGTLGTVLGVDDTGSLLMRWDNGSGLNVVYGEDLVRKL